MNDLTKNVASQDAIKQTGGIAPYGYRWHHGHLTVDEKEAPVRKLIYELFLRHRRKKTVARILNESGYRTRNDALFSDTTIGRLLADTTAKGIRLVDGKEIKVDPIVSTEVWERANNILNGSKPTKQPVHLFSGIALCACGGKMTVPNNPTKYVCDSCRYKIGVEDLEEIFISQLNEFSIRDQDLQFYWSYLKATEKRNVIEQICKKVTVGKTTIDIEFAFEPHSFKTPAFGQQNERGNETPISNGIIPDPSEPLLSEAEAAKFLGISKMTLLRKRNAGIIGHYRVGFRVLYSKEKHLFPFLKQCES
jgi:excisionase family DNA binding protein